MPFTGSEWSYGVHVEGRAPVSDADMRSVSYYAVGADYFRAMGMPILRGRSFTAQDRAGAPRVAIISQTLAQLEFPGQDPIGQRINLTNQRGPAWREVVGVVADVKQSSLDAAPEAQAYDPFAQRSFSRINLVVRLAGAQPGAVRLCIALTCVARTLLYAKRITRLRDGTVRRK